LPAASVSVTLKRRVPSVSAETLMPVIFWVAYLSVPVPVTGLPPPSLVIV